MGAVERLTTEESLLAWIPGALRKTVLCAATAVLASVPVLSQTAAKPPANAIEPAPATDLDTAPVPADTPQQRVSPLSGITQYQGSRVSDISFRGFGDLDSQNLREQIAQKTGQPLERSKVRSSIQTLYASGRFSTIQVEAARTPQQEVTLVFIASPNYFNGAITVEGTPKAGPTANQLVNASKLQLGELFTTEKVEQSIERMRKVFEDNGYYHVVITSEQTPRPQTQQMDIVFHVEPGEQARVGDVNIEGETGFSKGQIQDITKIHPGDRIRPDHLTRALQRLRKKYQKKARLEAQVGLVERHYNPDSNTVDYTFRVDRGPTIDIRVAGAKIGDSTLRRFIPVYEESAVDDDLLNEGKRNLRDYFQTKGYFDVNVDYRREPLPGRDHVSIVYDVDLGERHKLAAIFIDGNKTFSSELIRERMNVQQAGWLLSHGRYSQSLLARDIDSIRSLYQNNGYQQVKVTGDVKDDNARMNVVIHIDEGPLTLVNSVKIEGNSHISDEQLRNNLLNTVEGQPYSDVNLATDRESVLNYYFNHGFSDIELETTAKPLPNDPTRVDVQYKIKEGQQVFVDETIVGGLENTRPHIVNREFQFKRGDPLSQQSMLESQRKLYDLGIFTEVNMAVQNPDGQAANKNIVYQFGEAKRYTFNYGFGLEFSTGEFRGQGTAPQGETGVSPRVSFDVTRINFRGRDQSIIFKSRVGRLQQRVLLSFDSPRWLDLPKWRWSITAFYDNSRDVNTFASQRLEGSTQLQQTVNKSVTMLYQFAYRRVKVDPNSFPANFDKSQIPLFSLPVRVGIPSVTYIRDRRDDPIDSTKGSYSTADVGVAGNFFGSEANFSRVLLQNATYHQFKRKYVLARSTRIGIESPYGSADVRFVPLPERFFVGGGNSHRGFSINQAGPRDPGTGTPLGGNALFVNNLELRLPPVLLPFVQQNLSFVLFHDMGNAFTEGTAIWKNFFNYHQDNVQNCRMFDSDHGCKFDYMSHAVGAGIRYKTPIGPVRVDLGYNLNPPTFPVVNPTATTPAHYEVLRHFNIFFSIGQTF